MPDTEFLREGMKMGKTIKCDLSTKSIQNAIKKLKAYQNELQRKNEIFVKRLAEIGLDVIQTTMESIPDEEKGSYYTEIINDQNGNIVGASVRLSGEKVLFIEFSAGITYGTNDYPLSSGNSYGMEHILPKKKNQTGTIQTAGGTQMKADGRTIHMEIERICLCITQNRPLLLLFVKLLRKCSLLKEDTIIY